MYRLSLKLVEIKLIVELSLLFAILLSLNIVAVIWVDLRSLKDLIAFILGNAIIIGVGVLYYKITFVCFFNGDKGTILLRRAFSGRVFREFTFDANKVELRRGLFSSLIFTMDDGKQRRAAFIDREKFNHIHIVEG